MTRARLPQPATRKAARRQVQRERHQQRELVESLRERVAREAWQVRDDEPLPRID